MFFKSRRDICYNYMIERRMSIKNFCKLVGIDLYEFLDFTEGSESFDENSELVQKISKFLGISVEELLKFDEKKQDEIIYYEDDSCLYSLGPLRFCGGQNNDSIN